MLRNEILATLAYYDVLDFPLTEAEILRFLIKSRLSFDGSQRLNLSFDGSQRLNLGELRTDLNGLIDDDIMREQDGYYFLFDREYLIPLRKKREYIAKEKWRKAQRAIWWLRFVPYMRVIFASGSLSFRNTNELSDLDIILVVRHGRIWLSRLLVSGVLAFLGVRRTHEHAHTTAPDKICPNHYITDRSLAIPFHSIYTAQLYAHLTPLFYTDQNVIGQFQKENSWITDFLYQWNIPDAPIVPDSLFSKFIRSFFEAALNNPVGDWLERYVSTYQRKRIERRPPTVQPGGHLVYNDNQLAFHAMTSADEILKKYHDNLKRLQINT